MNKLPYYDGNILIKVQRNSPDLFLNAFNKLYHLESEKWRSHFKASFTGEEAFDKGGVKREWLTILSKEMFNPDYGFFSLAQNGNTYIINSDSGKYNSEHLEIFEFISKIMAK